MPAGPLVFERDDRSPVESAEARTFTLASGRTSHYYVDGRKVTLSAQGAAPSVRAC